MQAVAPFVIKGNFWLSLDLFPQLFDLPLAIEEPLLARLDETRAFIDHLLQKGKRVYGITTGFADLRNTSIRPEEAGLLSANLIRSHDAGIGKPFSHDITLGAMILRLHALSKGYSGFTREAMETLASMINRKVIPLIPCTGSLGASGDLAYLARLGRAMMGDDVPVCFDGAILSAKEALVRARITPFLPKAKEGLALTNGTPFMASMLAIAFRKEEIALKNMIALTALFLQAVGGVEQAFYGSIHEVRCQAGQAKLAKFLRPFGCKGSQGEVQNDYSIRCLPQIYGPRFELILDLRSKIEAELNAVTDNPLIFRGEEISEDQDQADFIRFDGIDWSVLSGGNFHGENLAAMADLIALSNAKFALTLERQLTYLMNPFRNKNALPPYLIPDPKKVGLESGFMITQYTANALTHKISLLAQPAAITNITSANEAEDVVSYGATACHKLLDQIALFEELLAIYLLAVAQSYSLKKEKLGPDAPAAFLFEKIEQVFPLPFQKEEGFGNRYEAALQLLQTPLLDVW